MHLISSLIFLGLTSFCLTDSHIVKQTIEELAAIRECSAELGVHCNVKSVIRYIRTEYPFQDKEKSKEFISCVLIKIGILTADGMFQSQNTIDYLANILDVQTRSQIVNHCITEEGDTIADKGYNYHECLVAEMKNFLL
ncbi:uncharacterized protein LOC131432765 [Malaya genurostris]|uniref:uncharacterized protein LOC131432765 n=1 Tax=Malaya genurostris TaxID=325434 RepID=UPI0026F38D37|nr:uncharacterized protein LOC131432765 [Malaya genurostris]